MQEENNQPAPPGKSARYRHIVATLARHGIGAVGAESRAEHVRQACEELGPTFIKLGQMLSTRGDLLPESYRAELMKLQDDVPAAEPAEIEDVIVAESARRPNCSLRHSIARRWGVPPSAKCTPRVWLTAARSS